MVAGVHNHNLDTEADIFGRDAVKLNEEMLEVIRTHKVQGNSDFGRVIKILSKKWPNHCFVPQLISNAIRDAQEQLRSGTMPELPEVLQLLQLLLERKAEDDRWVVQVDRDTKTNVFRRLFWMSPGQRNLYLRYCDVVLNDNTALSNRFYMPLSTFVVVDTDGRSAVVASALVCGERTQDYEWILKQLIGIETPKTILVDEDPAMEAACLTTVPDTKIINCIWHLGCQNLARNLSASLKERWNPFKSRFWRVRNALTEDEFDEGWAGLLKDFGNSDKCKNYLERLSERREHWAWPWVGTRFTAGMQSTQRVEQTHSYVKSLADRTTTLPELFDIIDTKVEMEKMAKGYARYRQTLKPLRKQTNAIHNMFEDIVEANSRYFGRFANLKMSEEMCETTFYNIRSHNTDPTSEPHGSAEDRNDGGEDYPVSSRDD